MPIKILADFAEIDNNLWRNQNKYYFLKLFHQARIINQVFYENFGGFGPKTKVLNYYKNSLRLGIKIAMENWLFKVFYWIFLKFLLFLLKYGYIPIEYNISILQQIFRIRVEDDLASTPPSSSGIVKEAIIPLIKVPKLGLTPSNSAERIEPIWVIWENSKVRGKMMKNYLKFGIFQRIEEVPRLRKRL